MESPDIVTFPLSMSSYNRSGMVFCNPELEVVVLRWLDHSNLEDSLALVDMAMCEMEGIEANALIFDMRKIPEQVGANTYLELAAQCVSADCVERFAVIGGPGMPANRQPSTEVLQLAEERGLRVLLSDDFAEVAEWMDTLQNNPEGPWLARDQPPNFWGTYGGCTYSIPEYSATVTRTAGNVVELPLVREALHKSYELHQRTKAAVGILDTSASPAISEGSRYLFTYKEIIVPMTSGAYRQVIHVHAGDALIVKEEAPPLAPLLESLGLPYFETTSLEEALKLLHIMQGKPPHDAGQKKVKWLSQLTSRVMAFFLAAVTAVEVADAVTFI
jgi:hypothetical protein